MTRALIILLALGACVQPDICERSPWHEDRCEGPVTGGDNEPSEAAAEPAEPAEPAADNDNDNDNDAPADAPDPGPAPGGMGGMGMGGNGNVD